MSKNDRKKNTSKEKGTIRGAGASLAKTIKGNIQCIAVSPSGLVAVGTYASHVAFLAPKGDNGVKLLSQLRLRSPVWSIIAWRYDGKEDTFLCGCESGDIVEVCGNTYTELRTVAGQSNTVYGLAKVSVNDRKVLASGSNTSPHLVTRDPDRLTTATQLPHGHAVRCMLSVSPYLFVGSSGSELSVYEYTGGQWSRAWEEDTTSHSGAVRALAYVSALKCIATGCYDNKVRIFNATPPFAMTHELEGHTSNVLTVAASFKVLASGSYDKSIRIWSLLTFKCIQEVKDAHTAYIRGMAWGPNPTELWSVGNDHFCRRWTGFLELKEWVNMMPHVLAVLFCRKKGAEVLQILPLDIVKMLISWLWTPPHPTIQA